MWKIAEEGIKGHVLYHDVTTVGYPRAVGFKAVDKGMRYAFDAGQEDRLSRPGQDGLTF